MDPGIANILHRGTLATLAGVRTFERGERCFVDGRVETVTPSRGELRGVVRPRDRGRNAYQVRLWLRADGLAYECTCPVGLERQLCNHTVAIALAHLARERARVDPDGDVLRRALTSLPGSVLVDELVAAARRDPAMADTLKRMCLEALGRQ